MAVMKIFLRLSIVKRGENRKRLLNKYRGQKFKGRYRNDCFSVGREKRRQEWKQKCNQNLKVDV